MESGPTIASTGAKTIQKIQIRILPYLFLLYVVSYLDRINIGFAALTMNKDLAITSQQFGLLVGIFFFGYFLFEIPSNLMLHKVGARVWIARILISWGIVAMLTGFVHSVHQLHVVRFLLGLAEAGYFPGIVLYLTYWFRQREQAQAIALFLTGLPFTSILGAPVSGLILDHVHWLGVSSWRWLLVLEGFPAVACGVLTYFLLPGRPSEAGFLTKDEKRWITEELDQEERRKSGAHKISAGRALTDGRVWHLACVGFTLNIGMYSLSFWMPQFVKSLSSLYSNTTIGVLVMIPYLVGLVAMVLVSRSSDRKMERKYHAAIPAVIAGISLVSLGAAHSTFSSIFFLCFASLGIYSVYGPFWSLPSEFLTGFAAASGIALISSVANLGGFVGPYAVGMVSQRTGNLYGGLALTGVSLFVCATLASLLPKRTRVSTTSVATTLGSLECETRHRQERHREQVFSTLPPRIGSFPREYPNCLDLREED
jgi:sugar phosphate permease